jgi:hypothetical protein
LQRYHHLLAQPDQPLLLNDVISVSRKEDISGNAHGSDARGRPAGQPALERA